VYPSSPFFFFFAVVGLTQGLHLEVIPPALFVVGFLELGFCELFAQGKLLAQAGFKLQSS
jgi:hypothetical protein